MNKHVASFFLAATCTLGCRSVLQRPGPAAHLAASSPYAAVPSQADGIAQLSDRAASAAPLKVGSPEMSAAEPHRVYNQAEPKGGKCHPAVSSKQPGALGVVGGHWEGTADHAGNDARAHADRQVVPAAAAAKTLAPRNPGAASRPEAVPQRGIARDKPPAPLLETAPIPQHRPEVLRPQFWYGAASVLGALFAYILAPLIVEFMKHRLGFARHQYEWRKQLKAEQGTPGRSENL